MLYSMSMLESTGQLMTRNWVGVVTSNLPARPVAACPEDGAGLQRKGR